MILKICMVMKMSLMKRIMKEMNQMKNLKMNQMNQMKIKLIRKENVQLRVKALQGNAKRLILKLNMNKKMKRMKLPNNGRQLKIGQFIYLNIYKMMYYLYYLFQTSFYIFHNIIKMFNSYNFIFNN
ncbi:hypothetical protein BCR36DRAFT_11538 [Piromyces finnis]|uniref:Transmembrane protein n=1 Tax=Piromyces finnis TaxID=1754191 RepID=A0A1Y1VF94_9FUNG|nr:hypothetical protein BCR36DRAFT_11538 [Piromyces finnis]|eukprot:ORX54785.1 hypothetical protein BCR36DRAFT_11538 [Piromyces finnis]